MRARRGVRGRARVGYGQRGFGGRSWLTRRRRAALPRGTVADAASVGGCPGRSWLTALARGSPRGIVADTVSVGDCPRGGHSQRAFAVPVDSAGTTFVSGQRSKM